MAKAKGVRIVFQQSLANHEDVKTVEDHLGDYPGLEELRQSRRLTSGYSGARVYLATAKLRGTPPAHWILKVGDADDLAAESEAHDLAMATPGAEALITKIKFGQAAGCAIIVYEFAGLEGQPPVDLEKGLGSYSATELLRAALRILSRWSGQPDWRSDHITKRLLGWVEDRLEQLPPSIFELVDIQTIYYPDLGEALSNPAYYIKRKNLRRIETSVPFSFTHGDLNLRNVLFATDAHKDIKTDTPRFIDFRHAGTDQWSIVDYAKLESCIRYECLPSVHSPSDLTEVVAFLDSSTAQLRLKRAPEVLINKSLQESWRQIALIRDAVAEVVKGNSESEVCYWVCLVSYAISFSAYATQPEFARRAAYLDASRLFSRYVRKPDLSGTQKSVALQPGLSPLVQSSVPPKSWAAAALLGSSVQAGNAILVAGPLLGRMKGVEPLSRFLQAIHLDLGREAPPTDSVRVLLASLHTQSRRQNIVSAIKDKIAKSSAPDEINAIATVPWAAVVSLHYHEHLRTALRLPTRELVIIDSSDDLSAVAPDFSSTSTIYFPLLADSGSRVASFPFSLDEFQDRLHLLGGVVELVRRRLRPISLVFWRCEELDIELLLELHRGASVTAESVDCYYLTDQDSPEREATLVAVGITPVRARLDEMIQTVPSPVNDSAASGMQWRRGDSIYPLPRVSEKTHGLLEMFTYMGSVSATRSRDDDFLLGGPVTIEDIRDGRVLRRNAVENDVLPALGDAMARRGERVRWVLLSGRPGAGLSTTLCLAADQVSVQELAPCFVVARPQGHNNETWTTAGQLLGEIANQTGRPSILFFDAVDMDHRQLDRVAEGVLERRGELVFVIGGRKDLIDRLRLDLHLDGPPPIEVSDSLTSSEWDTLARVLQRDGFSAHLSDTDLARRMEKVGLLLPAIYEATDRRNRKFQEIVSEEYYRYSSHQSLQKAYRLVCALGTFGFSLTQYWLLKAVGGQSLQEAASLLGGLSEDIVIESEGESDVVEGELLVGPRHRLIAEAVLDAAVPEVDHRLADYRSIVETANMSSRREGGTSFLSRKGAFVQWLGDAVGRDRARREVMELLDVALSRPGIRPIVEITMRHQYSLILRGMRSYEAALAHAEAAYAMDKSNPASAHVLGLAHESRALQSWRGAKANALANAIAAARSEEQEALSFFGQVRAQQPQEEYGYEAEARYLRKKHEVVAKWPAEWGDERDRLGAEARIDLVRGLRLLEEAAIRVRRCDMVESEETRARLLGQLGHFEEAWDVLQGLISKSTDPVQQSKVEELAAALAAAHDRWDLVEGVASGLVRKKMRSAYVYLVLDDALRHLGRDDDRYRHLRESAEEWNREDVDTLVRWSGLCCARDEWETAAQALLRADRAGQRLGFTTSQQTRRRGALLGKDGRTLTTKGRIERLYRPLEGVLRSTEGKSTSVDVYFRADENLRSELSVGGLVTFELCWSLRGLRAERVKPSEE